MKSDGPTKPPVAPIEAQPDWKKFEELALAIQKQLAPEAKVSGNVRLRGKSGADRQIDILIEQKAGQYDLRIVIDCKDYKVPVDVKDVEAFIGLLDDVGAQKGAMVAANGFTPAAKSRATGAGLDLFRLVDTAEHKWSTYISIPAVLSDTRVAWYSFTITSTGGRFSLNVNEDLRLLPTFRADGSVIDCLGNLALDRWEDGSIPPSPGEHRDIAISSEKLHLPEGSELFPVQIAVNAFVEEKLYFGQCPLLDTRGFRNEVDGVTHLAKGFTTAKLNPNDLAREWRAIKSVEELAVRPVMTLAVKSMQQRLPRPCAKAKREKEPT